MTTAVATCFYCKQPIDPLAQRTDRRITGWERKPLATSRKSGSDIVHREPVDEYAHSQCVDKVKWGIHVGQQALV